MAGNHRSPQSFWAPTVGLNQPHWIARKYWARKLSTKIGSATKISAITSIVLSKNLPLRSAEIVPMMIASVNSIAMAMTARRAVTGRVRASTSLTDWPEKVEPRSPWKMPVM